MRADRVAEFVKEHWGRGGLEILKAYQRLLSRVLRDGDRVMVRRIKEPALTLLATTTTISISAVCVQKEWENIIRCVSWIDEVLGTPTGTGSLRTLPPREIRNGNLANSKVIGKQLEELDALLHAHTEWNGGEWNSHHVLRTRGLELYRYPSKSEAHEFKSSAGEDCWRGLFEEGYVANHQMSYPLRLSEEGKGLCISFELMCAVAGIEQAVSVEEDGLVLAGFNTFLVPMRAIDDKRAIQ